MYKTIVLEREEFIAILRFNRANVLNALNRQVFLEIISIFDEIQKEVVPKVVILTGTRDRASFLAIPLILPLMQGLPSNFSNPAFCHLISPIDLSLKIWIAHFLRTFR